MSSNSDDESKEDQPQLTRERGRSKTEPLPGVRFVETRNVGDGDVAGNVVGTSRRPSLSLQTPPETPTRRFSKQLSPNGVARLLSPAGQEPSLVRQLSSATEASSSEASPRSILSAAIVDEVEAEVEGKRLAMQTTSGPKRRSSLFSSSPKARRPSSIGLQNSRTMSVSRVASLLNGFSFFKDFEPGVVQSLSHVVTQATYKAGTVLFCQGDPPGNCYVIVSGAIGVFFQAQFEEASPAKAEKPAPIVVPLRRTTRRTSTLPSLDDLTASPQSATRGRRRSSAAGLYDDCVSPLEVLATRIPTVEGFSLYHPEQDLGEQVATLPAGSITGEIALLHEQPRSASLKCAVDTSFIIINKEQFGSVLKAEMQRAREEKVNFLLEHLPGLRDVPVSRPGGRPHPSYYFKKTTVAKGHEFLKQGQMTKDPCLYIVLQGTVELRRNELSTHLDNLSKSEASRRLLTASMTRKGRPSSAMFRGVATPSRGGDGQGLSRISRHIGTLQVGSTFGSLTLAEAEPFTLLAGSGVEVFSVTTDMIRFPLKLMRAIQEYLTQAMTNRLQRLRACRGSDIMKQRGQAAHKMEPRPGTSHGIGLNLLLNGTLGTGKSMSSPALANSPSASRPQSAPIGGRLTSGKMLHSGGTMAGQFRSGSIPPPGSSGCANGLAASGTLLGRSALARQKRPNSAA